MSRLLFFFTFALALPLFYFLTRQEDRPPAPLYFSLSAAALARFLCAVFFDSFSVARWFL